MEVGKIVVGGTPRSAPPRMDPRPAWRALAWFALAFVFAALVDVSLAFYSSDMEQPVQRFAALAGASGSLPLLTIGALGCLMAALGAGSKRLILFGSVVSAVLCLAVLVHAVRFFLATSDAFAAAPPAGHPALNQALIRGWVFYGVFGLALGVGASIGLKASRGTPET